MDTKKSVKRKKPSNKDLQDSNKGKKQLLKSLRRYARSAGYKLQPDKKLLDTLITGELNNIKKHGDRYCPCRRVSGNKEKDKNIICPCIFHKDEIKKQGFCHCRLFLKK